MVISNKDTTLFVIEEDDPRLLSVSRMVNRKLQKRLGLSLPCKPLQNSDKISAGIKHPSCCNWGA